MPAKTITAKGIKKLTDAVRSDGSLAIPPGLHAKRAALLAFEAAGGQERFNEWADENYEKFIEKVYAKLITQEHVSVNVNGGSGLENMSEAELRAEIQAHAKAMSLADNLVDVDEDAEYVEYEDVDAD